MSKSINISNSVIRRLPRYYRFLGELEDQQISKISSRELSERMHLTASQIRQDLNCFGGFGQQGYGYNVSELRKEIGRILGVDKHRKTILIGAGNLGTALAVHINFEKSGCSLIGIFDSNKKIVGNPLGKLTITDIDELESFCRENKPEVAVLCIPKSVTKEIVDRLTELGVRSFWNFSHYDINVEHKNIIVENVHLGDSLLTLSYGVNNNLDNDK
ncbi:MAG: redox-sensing transcriptional repressor Rex [Ruminiclostridium sp.]|nr:redox-sensing transcriptional repressor Rex [Ruminiclostridium sp.]